MEFRKDIQVLRGVAVLLVIVYHLYPSLLPSGYLGVDIFFVISGFLMAVLYKEGNDKSYVKSFYRRRFHRILPAYLAVVITTIFIGGWILLPHELEELYKQGAAAVVLVPNIYFWSGESYFSGIVLRPLLHTWSLGVELQFYLLVPFIFWLYEKSKAFYFSVFALSLVACILALEASSKTAFFILPFRLWEFLFGFTVAFYFSRKGNRKFNSPYLGILSLLGLILLAYIDTDIGKHPGLFALITCIVTSIILVFGLPSQFEKGFIGRGLTVTGKYSYSLYLVHFPIIIFYYYSPFKGDVHAEFFDLDLLIVVALMVFFTYLLYHFFETNRLVTVAFTKNRLIISLIAGCFLVIPLSYNLNNQFTDKETILISNSISDRSNWRCGKIGKLRKLINNKKRACLINDVTRSEKGILLVGDSHADSIKTSLGNVSKGYNRPVYLMVESCSLGNAECRIDSVLELASNLNITTLVLHDLYYNTRYDTVEQLLAQKPDDLEVIFVEPIPTYKESVPAYLYRIHSEPNNATVVSNDLSFYDKEYRKYYRQLDKLEAKGVIRVQTAKVFCQPLCKRVSDTGIPYYFDNHHLTLAGAKLLENNLDEVIR